MERTSPSGGAAVERTSRQVRNHGWGEAGRRFSVGDGGRLGVRGGNRHAEEGREEVVGGDSLPRGDRAQVHGRSSHTRPSLVRTGRDGNPEEPAIRGSRTGYPGPREWLAAAARLPADRPGPGAPRHLGAGKVASVRMPAFAGRASRVLPA